MRCVIRMTQADLRDGVIASLDQVQASASFGAFRPARKEDLYSLLLLCVFILCSGCRD